MKFVWFISVMLLATCVSAKRDSKEAKEKSVGKSSKSGNQTSSRSGKGSGQKQERLNSGPPVEEVGKVIKFNGTKPDWNLIAKTAGKNETARLKKKYQELRRRKKNETNSDVHYDTSECNQESCSGTISKIKEKLSSFTSPLKSKVETRLTKLNQQWADLKDEDRMGVSGVMATILGNVEKMGNAGTDPKGAVQGVLNIVGSIAGLFGPTGQLVSMGLSFISGLLGLFGKGPKPKPLSEVVKEQVDKALNEHHFETLTDKANALINVYERSLSYLEGPLNSDSEIDVQTINLVACRIELDQGDFFVDELGVIIGKMFSANNAADAKKCISACEIYATLAGLKDMILNQLLTLSHGVLEVDAAGLVAAIRTHRNIARGVLEPLYALRLDSKTLPYFDPDISVVTDTYAKGILEIGMYDRSSAGLYCLSATVENERKDLIWSNTIAQLNVEGRPYTALASTSNLNCYWKLVPHGHNYYSIVNRKACDSDPPATYCGDVLSFSVVGSKAYANLKSTNGILWEIDGSDNKRLRSKWPCNSPSSDIYFHYCNQELKTSTRSYYVYDGEFFEDVVTVHVGTVLPREGDNYYWTLRRKQE